MANTSIETVSILGSSGSIGQSTLQILSEHPTRYRVYALSVNANVDLLFEQIQKFRPRVVSVVDERHAERLNSLLSQIDYQPEILVGQQGLNQISMQPNQTVVCGIVGAVGLESTLAAVKAGNKVLIANKEPLVMLGGLIMQTAKQSGAVILPLDSEHNAIFQAFGSSLECLAGGRLIQQIRRIVLTGSGGPFRTWSKQQMQAVTPEQACAHPNWSMGQKISVDSATMMNKGLELIEACVLYGVTPDQVQIVVHPQSVIHSMVEYVDGSVIAQMAAPDMRVPIAHALAWPERIDSGVESLDFFSCNRFDFEEPDFDRFPALRLAQQAAQQGGLLPTVMNAANEIAVQAFLLGQIGFLEIVELVESAMEAIDCAASLDMPNALYVDDLTRQYVRQTIQGASLVAK